jgi:hypothetical protein
MEHFFKFPQKLSWRILNMLSKELAETKTPLLRIAAFSFVWLVSSGAVAYAIFVVSGVLTALVCAPIAITFTYSMQEEVNHKPQKYRFPLLLILSFMTIAPILAAAGYMRNLQKTPYFAALYVLGMLSLLFLGGWMGSQLSKSMKETEKVDAIAWLLQSTPSQNLGLFKKAGRIASSPDYRPRLLESLLPLLSPLIVRDRTNTSGCTEEQVQSLNIYLYVSCLERLSHFKDDEGSLWRLWEDKRWHPTLENEDPVRQQLRIKLMELTKDPSSLGNVAKKVLENYSYNPGTSSGPGRSCAERFGLRSRHKHGNYLATSLKWIYDK